MAKKTITSLFIQSGYLGDMNSELRKYIYESIVPQYAEFDSAHREDHVLNVMDQAVHLLEGRNDWLSKHYDADPIWSEHVDPDLLITAAACHDLGLVNGRDRHHLDSGDIIRNDERLKEWFNQHEIELIAQAAEDHRASGKSAPRSIYGMIVAEADRVIDVETIIRRTIQFGFKHYPDLNRKKHVARAVEHLKEKYGYGGYLRLWIPWSENAARLYVLQELISNTDTLTEEIERIYDSLTTKLSRE